MIVQILFILVAAVTLISAIFAVTVRKMMHAALWLVLSLFGVAVIFAMLETGFFAIVQVLVYIGAIAILIIFAAMLTRHVMSDVGPQVTRYWWVALIASGALFAALLIALGGWPGLLPGWAGFEFGPGTVPDPGLIQQFGMNLVDPEKFAIPFEVASVLLLGALVGAIYIAADKKGGKG
jgi:NADH-quinone oxidoreductase subunit J